MKNDCFILGNSSTLKNHDLSCLENKVVFVCNKGYKSLDLGLKHFNYYVISDPNFVLENQNEIEEKVNSQIFMSSAIASKKNVNSDLKKRSTIFKRSKNEEYFRLPASLNDPWGRVYTVVLDAAIIAYLLGYKKIHLLGYNLDFNKNNIHFYTDTDKEKDRKIISINQIPNILKITQLIKLQFQQLGIEIVNCSDGWEYTDILDYKNFKNVVE